MKKIIYFLWVTCILMACNKTVRLSLEDDNMIDQGFSGVSIVNKMNPEKNLTQIITDGEYLFTVKMEAPASNDEEFNLSDASTLLSLVEQYNGFNLSKEYILLPDSVYDITPINIKQGEKEVDVKLTISNTENLPQGLYILPLRYTLNGENILHTVEFFKDAEYSALSANNKKPMPPGSYSCPLRTEPIKMVAYVETNNWDIRNLAQFVLKDSKKPVFDYITIFAANMNYDAATKKRVLHFNDKLQPFVKDPQRFTKPLRDRGIKLIVDILPNHQGVGYDNFQSYEDALEFARECKMWADKLGIDGFDIDEEYADYYVQPGLPVKGAQSIFWFMRAMKEVMPDKLLTIYEYSLSIHSNSVDELGKTPKDYLDFSVSDYNVTSSSMVGMPSHLYANRSIEGTRGSLMDFPDIFGSDLEFRAISSLEECNGYQMIFNIKGGSIRNGNAAKSLSYITKEFYGEETIFSGKYHEGPNDL